MTLAIQKLPTTYTFHSLTLFHYTQKITSVAEKVFILSSIGALIAGVPIVFGALLGTGALCILTSFFLHIQENKRIPHALQNLLQRTNEQTVSRLELYTTLNLYGKIFHSPSNDYLGFIEKKTLPAKSTFFYRADLHGDFASLKANLLLLQKQGILNDKFQVTPIWKGKCALIFLGDYVDRGPDACKVISTLMWLKILNPDEVVLLRGNHENTTLNRMYGSPDMKKMDSVWGFFSKLESFYRTLPLALLLGNQGDKQKFTLFSHGLLDPDIDVNPLLESDKSNDSLFISKKKPFLLSDRLINLLPTTLRGKKIEEIQEVYTFLEKGNLSKAKSALQMAALDQKQAKFLLSALRVQDFLIEHRTVIEKERKEGVTSFNWGDVSKHKPSLNTNRGCGLVLTPSFIKDYFRIMGTSKRKIKAMRRGHSHEEAQFSWKKKKKFIATLPVAMDLCPSKAKDICYMGTLFSSFSDWKEQRIVRTKNSNESALKKATFFYGQGKPFWKKIFF
ncbi:MAG: metallophosphoesterase family protein [Chlamydiota bacterium]